MKIGLLFAVNYAFGPFDESTLYEKINFSILFNNQCTNPYNKVYMHKRLMLLWNTWFLTFISAIPYLYFAVKFTGIHCKHWCKIYLFSCDHILFFKTIQFENKTTDCYSNLIFHSISCAEHFLYFDISQVNSFIRTLERINYERSKTINCKLHYCSIYIARAFCNAPISTRELFQLAIRKIYWAAHCYNAVANKLLGG